MNHAVAIICPTHDRGPAIGATIASVQAQTVSDWELLVVADGCRDQTAAVVRALAEEDPRVRLLETDRWYGHPSEPRNIGTAAARSETIAYLDHDDEWRPDHLACALGELSTRSPMVASGYEQVDAAGTALARSNNLELVWHEQIQELGPLFEPSRVVLRREVVEEVGGWRSGVGLEDWDLWLRLADAGHRFRTHVRRTALLLQDTRTRRYSTIRPHRLPLGQFEDPRQASSCRRELQSPHVFARLSSAAVEDVSAWYSELEASGSLVLPTGVTGPVATLLEGTSTEDFRSQFDDLVLLQRGRAIEISIPLWSATSESAARVASRLAGVHGRQFRIIAEIIRQYGGEPGVPASSKTWP